MSTFVSEGFGLQIPDLDCDHDSDTVKSLIKTAMNNIEDGFDYIGMFQSMQYIIGKSEVFTNAFKDCPQLMIVLNDAAAVSEPLRDQQLSLQMMAEAAMQNPFTFASNINRAKTALSQRNWVAAGYYMGQNLHDILDAAPE